MTRDEAALLRAVVAAPDDDTPRLVFADWLDEHGQPDRAEFIRLQCELARLTADSPRRREVAFRCRKLLDAAGARLCPEPLRVHFPFCRLARGFVEAAEFDATYVGHGAAAAAFEVAPIRRAGVSDLGGEVDPLKHIPTGNVLTALDLTGNDLGADALRRLAGFRRFPRLRELGLMFNRLDDEAVGVLCDRPFFQRLSLLKLGANPFTDAGRRRLRDHFGDRVTFECERDDDHLYAIQDDDFRAGFGNDHTQLLMVESDVGTRLAVFDHAGDLLRTERRDLPPAATQDWRERKAFNDRWRDELGFRPATIRVKRFKFPDGVGIEGFASGWVRAFDDPDSDEIETARGWLESWLDWGKFRWTWVGDDWWLNRDGEVTDT